jgi:hypothetical protein
MDLQQFRRLIDRGVVQPPSRFAVGYARKGHIPRRYYSPSEVEQIAKAVREMLSK